MQHGSLVSLRYTLSLDDGQVVDTNEDGEPLRYVHGHKEILPALEEILDDLDEGQSTEVTLPPERAYGEVDPEAFKEVPPETVPEEAREVGTRLAWEDEQGRSLGLRVHEVRDDAIVLDMNHPLAGRTITFALCVLDVLSPADT